MTLAQFIVEVFNNTKDPCNIDQRIGQIVMNTLSVRNPKLYNVICNETNYDCFYNSNMVASTIAYICEHPEYWEQ